MKEKIKKYILENFLHGDGSIEDDEQLFETGIINSIGFVKLLAYIEKTYDVPIDISEVTADCGTLNDIMGLINGKLENK
jgi:acyl carrier protein